MKLRLLGNSIRLRLSQTEVRQLQTEGLCSSQLNFPNGQTFHYELMRSGSMDCSYSEKGIRIEIDQKTVNDWVNTDQVGFEGSFPLENGDKLSILVEKDFKCLTERIEDESDLFPNPNESH